MAKLSLAEMQKFAESFKIAKLNNNMIQIGSLFLPAKFSTQTEYLNFSGKDYLDMNLQYDTQINGKNICFLLQLYNNITSTGNKQFRLASYSLVEKKWGMIFSINLTQQKELNGKIFLTSKVKFTNQSKGEKSLNQEHRKMKQNTISELLNNLGFDQTETNDVLFGIFDTTRRKFIDTSPNKLLNDFLVVSILKGHFMGNKGYNLEILPSFKKTSGPINSSRQTNLELKLSSKMKEKIGKRIVSLGLRYKVLHRDKSKCKTCGKTPSDGIKLHIDHIKPYSLGGLTILENLRTLCDACNIGRSNKYLD